MPSWIKISLTYLGIVASGDPVQRKQQEICVGKGMKGYGDGILQIYETRF
jgi:hypothetical protein